MFLITSLDSCGRNGYEIKFNFRNSFQFNLSFNKEIKTYNMQVPAQQKHEQMLQTDLVQREIYKIDKR